MDDIKLAMLGSKEAAKRLTDAGVLVPCPFCKNRDQSTLLIMQGTDYWVACGECGAEGPYRSKIEEARLAWNTRAPILSAEEVEMLDEH